ncbi:MAG: DUF1156 domain-containing protein [Anaerolineae bacterium]|nr:DUF1156 domain-containing protein [Anaerolineae bacterium]
MTYKKKLIEVALPLDAINAESAREKSIRHGHPSTLHLWWARRPLAACRAVIFAQMVDDPSAHPELFPTEADQAAERERLFDIIRDLVLWENVNNEKVLEQARAEIRRWAPPEGLPPLLDPFAGGGSIPLEAQRLGLEAHASDLNPVAVLINKALIEIPPKFANLPPVNPASREQKRTVQVWRGAQGLAEDVRYYGQWMRDEAEKRIGHLYPPVTVTAELLAERPDLKQQGLQPGEQLTVIAWLWARTVKCPNPVCGIHMPLLSSFVLSSKTGREAFISPSTDGKTVSFAISSTPPKKYGDPKKGLKRGMSGIFECVSCGAITTRDYVSEEGKAKRLGVTPTAVVAEGNNRRLYLPAESSPLPKNIPIPDTTGLTIELSPNPRDVWCRNFGLDTPADLFTDRQLVALTTFSDLVGEARPSIIEHALAAGWDEASAVGYGTAVATYLGMAVSRLSDIGNALARWENTKTQVRGLFSRQAIPMVWDFAEPNLFAQAAGDYSVSLGSMLRVFEKLPSSRLGHTYQHDASLPFSLDRICISCDPPYYDNIGYADLSDFFYVWLRRSLKNIYPDIFPTLLVPKKPELVATPYRFEGDKQKAQAFFEAGLQKTFSNMRASIHPEYPLTVYYAFKQAEMVSEKDMEGTNLASTGWETMLEGLIQSGFSITGTWPIRTELSNRPVASGTNALASSIVLVCRPRPDNAPLATRRDFLNALRRELPAALKELQHGNIAPVDLAQASIGPGMAIFSRYARVLEADGAAMRVRTALALINQALDEYLSEQEGAYDTDTRWALAWFEQHGFQAGAYGDAETLSTAKNTSVGGMVSAGILQAGGGKVRLLRRDELAADWDPHTDKRLTVWEICQQLIRRMEEQGETAAAQLLADAGPLGDAARDLAYRLYQVCERKGWAAEALPYNALIVSWSEMGKLSRAVDATPVQRGFNFS